MAGKHTVLTPAEWEIMRVVWEKKEVIVRDVFEALRESRGWAQTTVRTMMERLARKGHLAQKKIGPICVYKPAVSRKKVVRRAVRDALSRLTGGSVAELVSYAVEDGKVSESELAELEKLIMQWKEKRHDRRSK